MRRSCESDSSVLMFLTGVVAVMLMVAWWVVSMMQPTRQPNAGLAHYRGPDLAAVTLAAARSDDDDLNQWSAVLAQSQNAEERQLAGGDGAEPSAFAAYAWAHDGVDRGDTRRTEPRYEAPKPPAPRRPARKRDYAGNTEPSRQAQSRVERPFWGRGFD